MQKQGVDSELEVATESKKAQQQYRLRYNYPPLVLCVVSPGVSQQLRCVFELRLDGYDHDDCIHKRPW